MKAEERIMKRERNTKNSRKEKKPNEWNEEEIINNVYVRTRIYYDNTKNEYKFFSWLPLLLFCCSSAESLFMAIKSHLQNKREKNGRKQTTCAIQEPRFMSWDWMKKWSIKKKSSNECYAVASVSPRFSSSNFNENEWI